MNCGSCVVFPLPVAPRMMMTELFSIRETNYTHKHRQGLTYAERNIHKSWKKNNNKKIMNIYVHWCLASLCMYLLSVLSNGQNWILITGQWRGGGSWTYSSEITCQNRLNSEQELCNYILVGNIKAKNSGKTDVNRIVQYWFKLITSVKIKNSSRNIQCSVYVRSSLYVCRLVCNYYLEVLPSCSSGFLHLILPSLERSYQITALQTCSKCTHIKR